MSSGRPRLLLARDLAPAQPLCEVRTKRHVACVKLAQVARARHLSVKFQKWHRFWHRWHSAEGVMNVAWTVRDCLSC